MNRQTRSQRLTSQHWAAKQAAARSPEDRAALEFDRARSTIRKVRDAAERDRAWGDLQATLAGFNRRLGGDRRRHSQVRSSQGPGPLGRSTRRGAHARETSVSECHPR